MEYVGGFFPNAKGSRFTFGGLGVDLCSRDPAFGVRNRPQPFATVRNRLDRLQPSVCDRRGRKVAVPMGKFSSVRLTGGSL